MQPNLSHLSNRSLKRTYARAMRRLRHAKSVDFDPQVGEVSRRHMRHAVRATLFENEIERRVAPTHKWSLSPFDAIRELTRVHFSLLRRTDVE